MSGPPNEPETPDHYAILRLSQHVSDAEILQAFKNLKRKYHPDSKLPDSEPSEEKFKQVGQAYDVLGNKDLRSNYDQHFYQAWATYHSALATWRSSQQPTDTQRQRPQVNRQSAANNDSARRQPGWSLNPERRWRRQTNFNFNPQRYQRAAYDTYWAREAFHRHYLRDVFAEVTRRQREEREREREQCKQLEERKRRAVEERLREEGSKKKQEEERLAEKRRAVDERERMIFKRAKERMERATRERLFREEEKRLRWERGCVLGLCGVLGIPLIGVIVLVWLGLW